MTLRRPPAATAAFACYRRAGLARSTRAHIALRWLSCPTPAVVAEVPAAGHVLDVGCGHGFGALYLALDSPTRVVHGVDVDDAKIVEARQAAASLPADPIATFEAVPPGWLPPAAPTWDAIVINDVLYLLGEMAALELVAAAAAALAPGGRLVVKEIDIVPRWKYRLAVLQELAATRLAKVTAGDHVAFCQPDRLIDAMRDAGLEVRTQPIGRYYPHPHLLFVGQRPA